MQSCTAHMLCRKKFYFESRKFFRSWLQTLLAACCFDYAQLVSMTSLPKATSHNSRVTTYYSQKPSGPRLKMTSKALALWLALYSFKSCAVSVTIHGGWSPWSKLETDCVKLDETTGAVVETNVLCGGGVKIKTRSCTNPVPQVR